ncbi:MAG: hypothetical protein ACPGU0_03885, partial [Marinirhabdus sp.]
MKKHILFAVLIMSVTVLKSQEYFPKNDGLKQKNTNCTAFTNATIYVTPTQILKKGTLVVKDGKVTAVGKNAKV